MTSETPELGLILIVSKQLSPHLQSVAHYLAQRPPLKRIVVLHTDNEKESKQPAERLLHVLSPICSTNSIELLPEDVGIEPRSVRKKMLELKERYPSISWIVNMTGGNKLMPLGLNEAARDSTFTLVYREIWERKWYRVSDDGSGPTISEDIDIDDGNLDTLLAPSQIASTQLELTTNERIVSEPVPTNLPSVEEWLNYIKNHKCTLKQGLSGLGVNNTSANPFELLVYLILRDFFDITAEWSLKRLQPKVNDEGETKWITNQEVDIAFMRQGRLMIVDCTAKNDEKGDKSRGAQLHESYSTKNRYGGLEGGYLMARPTMLDDPEFEVIVGALRIDYANASRMRTPCRTLNEWIFGKNAPSLTDAQVEIDDLMSQLAAPDWKPPIYGQPFSAEAPAEKVWDLSKAVEKKMNDTGFVHLNVAGLQIVVTKTDSSLDNALSKISDVKNFPPSEQAKRKWTFHFSKGGSIATTVNRLVK